MAEGLDHIRFNFYLDCLQNMHQSSSANVQRRISNELLPNLALCLLDDTVFEIVKHLVDIQNIIEKDLYAKRSQMENSNMNELQQCMGQLSEEMLNSMEIKHDEKLQEFDKWAIGILDKELEEQQRVLEKVGVPGFFITKKSDDIVTQMLIIDFILRLNDIPFDPK